MQANRLHHANLLQQLSHELRFPGVTDSAHVCGIKNKILFYFLKIDIAALSFTLPEKSHHILGTSNGESEC
jgi:hypothetical protein